LRIENGRIGYERGPVFVPASYASMHLHGASVVDLLRRSLPEARLRPVDDLLAKLRAKPTPREAARIRLSCRLAERAFLEGARQLRVGMKEYEVAELFRAPLHVMDLRLGVQRADGFVACLSGVNSAGAYGTYARSRDREIEPGDFVMIHCNSYADGYWTDITRTFVMGEAGPRKLEMYGAVHAALRAAMEVIRPGARAADVDAAAREALISRGFGCQFKHATGHGVGFAVIDHNALPRLHPASDDRLEAGMIFNVKPAIYLEGFGGLRHCDMAMVTETGVEVLTPFQSSIEHLVIRSSANDEAFSAESAAAMV
jgi:Xaa-Pro dipeptidase